MKRAIAVMLALVLSLGVVAPTWAEETGEEDVVLQATGETYDAGEDTAAPMMMLAAQSVAANTVTEIENRLAAYIAVCKSFKESHEGKVYWTAQQWASKWSAAKETEEKNKIDAQRGNDGQTEMETKAKEGDYLAGLSDVGCTVTDAAQHRWKYHTCNSNYFKGVDSGFGQCQGFTDYLAYVLFGEPGKDRNNFDEYMNLTLAELRNFSFQPGDIVRLINPKDNHSFMVYKGTGTGAMVIECNNRYGLKGIDRCNIYWGRTVNDELTQFNTGGYVLRPKDNLQVTTACPYAPHEAGATLSDGTYRFRTAQKDGKWTALCKGCGVVYDYMASFNTGDAGVYKVVDATGDGLCSAPYKEASISPLTVGNKVTVIGSVKNAYDNKWMQTADGWIYSGKLKRAENAPTIVNSGYCGGEGDGTNLSWTLDSEGLLTISGRGKMFYDFSFKGWENQRDDVREVIIQQGVATVADGAFAKSHNLANITLPDSISFIGSSAFYYTALTSITIPGGVEGIGQFAFEGCADLTDVYYGGTRAQWNAITIRNWNEPLMSANIHFLATGATVRPGTGAKQEVKAGADGKMAITVPNVVNNKAATVTFDQAAVENISGYGDMTLTVKDNTANLSGILKNSAEVKGKNAASIIVTLTKADGTPVFTEGTSAGEAVITIPYKTGLVAEKIRVFYVNGEKLTSQAFTYNALTGPVTLKLAHFSEYLIVSESEGAPTPTPGTGTPTSGHGQAASSGASGAKITSAETFDPGVGVYAVTAVLSLTGMAWIRRKRR